jgi:hypothetical protein
MSNPRPTPDTLSEWTLLAVRTCPDCNGDPRMPTSDPTRPYSLGPAARGPARRAKTKADWTPRSHSRSSANSSDDRLLSLMPFSDEELELDFFADWTKVLADALTRLGYEVPTEGTSMSASPTST